MPSTDDFPLISVIIPVYNGAAFLPDAFETLRAQAYTPLEIVIVDDGSTDESAAIAACACIETPAWSVRLIRQANAGPSAARNAGLNATHGDLVQFLDVDDSLPPNKLRDQIARLTRQPELDVFGGYTQAVNLPGANAHNLFFNHPEALLTFNLGAALFRRRVFERVGIFNPDLCLAEDVDFFFRFIEAGCVLAFTKQVALTYRQHETNLTRNETRAANQRALMRVMHDSLKRRRNPDQTVRPMRELTEFIEDEAPVDDPQPDA
ncbi:MAG: glycosyltransferase family A protein [Chloroflexota bacterium]